MSNDGKIDKSIFKGLIIKCNSTELKMCWFRMSTHNSTELSLILVLVTVDF